MNIGLVLAGGMAKGAYQIGALQALSEFVPLEEIKYISCASIGVLNGYAYATGNLAEAETMWRNFCKDDKKLIISQVLKSSVLQENIVNLYESKSELSSDFYCVLLDLSHRSVVYKNLSTVESGHIPLYLKASVAMPVFNRAVQVEDVSYFDGAMIDNIPVFPLTELDLDYVICIHFDETYYKFENADFDNKTIKIHFPSDSMLKQSLVFEKSSIETAIKDGYERTNEILSGIFVEGHDNLEFIYKKIEEMNQSNKGNSLRITGDIFVTNLNKITKRLTKRKIL